MNCTVTDLTFASANDEVSVTAIHLSRRGEAPEITPVREHDLVFFQNGSMTDASSLGSLGAAPPKRSKVDSGGWALWERLAKGRPQFGNPGVFNSCIAQSWWESFTVTLKDSKFFDEVTEFTGNEPVTGGLVTFKDPTG